MIPPITGAALVVGAVGGVAWVVYDRATNGRDRALPLQIPSSAWTSPQQQELIYKTAGSYIYEGLSTPYAGWVWRWSHGGGSWRNFWVQPTASALPNGCDTSINPPGIPSRMTPIQGNPHGNCGSYWNCGAGPDCHGGIANAAIITTPDLIIGALEDYNAQNPVVATINVDPANPPANLSQLESRALQLLATEDYETLRYWYGHHFSPRCNADPLNPGATKVPQVLSGETATEHAECLSTLGVTHVRTELDYADADLEHAPGEIVSVSPDPGSGATGEEVTVVVNPPVDGLLEDTANALKNKNPQAQLGSQVDAHGNATVAETMP